jgi:glycosyltransferase involved in cell wall biosynthesis
MRRPVLTTAVGSLPETIVEEVNGWLVPAGDPGALADRLIQLAEDPGRAHLPVCEGRSGIPSWEDLARTVLDLAGGSEGPAS